jgi:hypothetical protein
MEEVEAVAKAKGLSIPDGTVDRLLKQCTDVGGLGLPSSMMVDNFEGRPMETEVSLRGRACSSELVCDRASVIVCGLRATWASLVNLGRLGQLEQGKLGDARGTI